MVEIHKAHIHICMYLKHLSALVHEVCYEPHNNASGVTTLHPISETPLSFTITHKLQPS